MKIRLSIFALFLSIGLSMNGQSANKNDFLIKVEAWYLTNVVMPDINYTASILNLSDVSLSPTITSFQNIDNKHTGSAGVYNTRSVCFIDENDKVRFAQITNRDYNKILDIPQPNVRSDKWFPGKILSEAILTGLVGTY